MSREGSVWMQDCVLKGPAVGSAAVPSSVLKVLNVLNSGTDLTFCIM